MTLNVYFGTDLERAYNSKDLMELVAALGETWKEVVASDIPGRAARIAHAIAKEKPDVLALQEAARWSSGMPGEMRVEYDFIELILAALHHEGAPYVPVAIRKDLDQMAPMDPSGTFARIEDRHAVLMRAESAGRLQPYDIIGGDFVTNFQTSNPVTGTLVSPRSWIAVDWNLGDRKFRLIECHVESLDHAVQLAQTRELIAGPASSQLPLIFAGDLNSNANRDPKIDDYSDAYPAMIDAGFIDIWASLNSDDLGNTCCHARDLRNEISKLNRRIDVVLTRGEITPVSAELVLNDPSVRTPSGVWPTDHAGIVTDLKIG